MRLPMTEKSGQRTLLCIWETAGRPRARRPQCPLGESEQFWVPSLASASMPRNIGAHQGFIFITHPWTFVFYMVKYFRYFFMPLFVLSKHFWVSGGFIPTKMSFPVVVPTSRNPHCCEKREIENTLSAHTRVHERRCQSVGVCAAVCLL